MKHTVFTPYVSGNRLALTALALVVMLASAAGARAWLTSGAEGGSPVPPTPSEPGTHSAAQGGSGQGRVETEVVTLLPTGFRPSEITRPRGRFLLLVDNRSGLEEVTLRLERVAGGRLREVRRTKEELIWRQVEDLPPGEYRLTQAGHTEWACRITITPQ